MYLLDTNIVSLLDPRRREEAQPLVDWLERNGASLYVSAVTLFELEVGVQNYEGRGASRRARELRALRTAIASSVESRVLPVSLDVALAAGRLWAAAQPVGPGPLDLFIAGTAEVHGLTVLTRNMRHFGPTGVACLDPLVSLPPDA